MKNKWIYFAIAAIALLCVRLFMLWIYNAHFVPRVGNFVQSNYLTITSIVSVVCLALILMVKPLKGYLVKVFLMLGVAVCQWEYGFAASVSGKTIEQITMPLGNNYYIATIKSNPLGVSLTTCHVVHQLALFEDLVYNFNCGEGSVTGVRNGFVYIQQKVKRGNVFSLDTIAVRLGN